MKKTFIFSLILSLSFSASTYAQVKTAIPVGETVGISLITDGLLVTDTADLECENGATKNPAKSAGIRKGDRLLTADGNKIYSSAWLKEYVSSRQNDIVLSINRSGESFYTVVTPVKSKGEYQIGIWVKDSIAGIGTITFILPEIGTFGALGHGIADSDTGVLLTAREGKLFSCNLNNPKKGCPGTPGELQGRFSPNILGEFSKNTNFGIFGKIQDSSIFSQRKEVPIAKENEIHEGKATILSNVDGKESLEYEIEILKTDFDEPSGKNFILKVTDAALLDKTGGIVQGMSGSPILQDGKLIGAVTHVFVNDPTRGYAIFIENMLSEAEKIK